MTHMEIWNQFAKPPASALKEIAGGRLRGMTDINPQWRLEAMTRAFGPCGIGWKYDVFRFWTEPGHEGEVLAFAHVRVYLRTDDEWSAPIPGIGGNKLIAMERGGLRSNDEGYKMAVTDALSVAFKALGVGAEIYAGRWDGASYSLRPEDMVTEDQLNQLKLNYHKMHSAELEGLDRPQIQARFAIWCREIIGEDIDYGNASRWTRDWYDACWETLSGISSDVPFEEAT